MGLSSLPAPSEGVLCVLLVNTALSISIVKGIVRSILHIVGIRLSPSASLPSSDNAEDTRESLEFRLSPPENYIEEFRSRMPSIRFNTVCSCEQPEHDCSVCLTQFEPESEINSLSCGHIFHKMCLEKWLDYWNITCPLCRTPLLPEEDASCFWWAHTTMYALSEEFSLYSVYMYLRECIGQGIVVYTLCLRSSMMCWWVLERPKILLYILWRSDV
jgi:hypothetical protein